MIIASTITFFVMFTGPEHQVIQINPEKVTTFRRPRGNDHLGKETHCVIFTTDGKFISVVESCEEVHDRLEKSHE